MKLPLLKYIIKDEKIKLSDEQKQKAKTLNEDYRKKMDDLRKKDDILVKDWRNQMMELNKKHREGMSALLSKEQKEQIGKMKVIRENRSQDMMKKRVEMKELIQKRNENMRSILNDEQMKKMQEMRKSMPRKRRVLS